MPIVRAQSFAVSLDRGDTGIDHGIAVAGERATHIFTRERD